MQVLLFLVPRGRDLIFSVYLHQRQIKICNFDREFLFRAYDVANVRVCVFPMYVMKCRLFNEREII